MRRHSTSGVSPRCWATSTAKIAVICASTTIVVWAARSSSPLAILAAILSSSWMAAVTNARLASNADAGMRISPIVFLLLVVVVDGAFHLDRPVRRQRVAGGRLAIGALNGELDPEGVDLGQRLRDRRL